MKYYIIFNIDYSNDHMEKGTINCIVNEKQFNDFCDRHNLCINNNYQYSYDNEKYYSNSMYDSDLENEYIVIEITDYLDNIIK